MQASYATAPSIVLHIVGVIRSFFIDTVTTIPDELVHIITVQEGKSTHGNKVVDDAIMDEI